MWPQYAEDATFEKKKKHFQRFRSFLPPLSNRAPLETLESPEISVQGHKLCSVPSNLDYVEEVAKQRALRVDGAALTSVRFRKQWTVWAPAAESRWQGARKSGRNGRFPFYALWRARTNGVCYCWRDAQRSIAGLPEARVRGFASEVQARQYARRMCVV